MASPPVQDAGPSATPPPPPSPTPPSLPSRSPSKSTAPPRVVDTLEMASRITLPPSVPPVSLVPTISETPYARHRRALGSLVQALRDLRVESTNDLPRVALIGPRGSGKSTIVQALAGIRLCHAESTSCPIVVNLRRAPTPWSCIINLRLEYERVDGAEPREAEVIPFGDIVVDPNLVGPAVRRAQAAALQPVGPAAPEADPHKPREEPVEQVTSDTLRKNVVSCDITGPDVTDLTFIDLPGIDPRAPAAVTAQLEDLVRRTLRPADVILLALPLNDPDTAQATGLARSCDPDGQRTLGVFTKPDLLARGPDARWLAAFRAQRTSLKNGYHVVQLGRNVSGWVGAARDEACAEEQLFFRRSPWSVFRGGERGRLGIIGLVTAVSRILCLGISQKVDSLKQSLVACRLDTESRLASLPPPLAAFEPSSQLLSLINRLYHALRENVAGAPGHERLWREARVIYARLKDEMTTAMPHFSGKAHMTDAQPGRTDSPLRIQAADLPAAKNTATPLGIRTGGLPGPVPGQASTPRAPFAEPMTPPPSAAREEPSTAVARRVVTLDEVRAVISGSRTRELPGSIPYSSKETLMTMQNEGWQKACHSAVEALVPVFSSIISQEVRSIFARFEDGGLLQDIWAICNERVATFRARTQDFVAQILALDEVAYTQNADDFAAIRSSTAQRLQAELYARPAENADPEVRKLFQRMEEATSVRRPQSLGDIYEDEMAVASECAAYIEIAHKHLCDTVPMAIHQSFLRPLPEAILHTLTLKLEVGSPIVAERRMRESPVLAARRLTLQEKARRLGQAEEEVARFEAGMGCDTPERAGPAS